LRGQAQILDLLLRAHADVDHRGDGAKLPVAGKVGRLATTASGCERLARRGRSPDAPAIPRGARR
jgi:hypothetical protein